MKRVERDTPEWHQEWANLRVLLEAWKITPDNKVAIAAVKVSLEKLGLIGNDTCSEVDADA